MCDYYSYYYRWLFKETNSHGPKISDKKINSLYIHKNH